MEEGGIFLALLKHATRAVALKKHSHQRGRKIRLAGDPSILDGDPITKVLG